MSTEPLYDDYNADRFDYEDSPSFWESLFDDWTGDDDAPEDDAPGIDVADPFADMLKTFKDGSTGAWLLVAGAVLAVWFALSR